MKLNGVTLGWVEGKWTGSDAPFLKIQQEVRQIERDKLLNRNYIQDVQRVAEEHPLDAGAQFRWGFAILRGHYHGLGPDDDRMRFYDPIVSALARPKSPKSYVYDRLRFLLMTLHYEAPPLKKLGKRLLRRNPRDTPVKAYLVGYMVGSRKKTERDLGLKYARELVHSWPKWGGAYSVLGRAYDSRLKLFGEVAAADKGIWAYQTYIQLLPKTDKKSIDSAKNMIDSIRKEKARQQRYGFKTPKDVIWSD